MLDVSEINKAINELEAGNTTFSACGKLADLYIVRDYLTGYTKPDAFHDLAYSQAASVANEMPLDLYGDSEFLQAVSGKKPQDAWGVIDDLMETLRVVNVRVYDSVLRKIKAL